MSDYTNYLAQRAKTQCCDKFTKYGKTDTVEAQGAWTDRQGNCVKYE